MNLSLRRFFVTKKEPPLGSSFSFAFGLRFLGGQGGVHQGLEGVHVGDGQVSQDLPIHFDAGQLETVDQVGVVGAANTGRFLFLRPT